MAEHHNGTDQLVVAYYNAIARAGAAHYARMSIASSELISPDYLADRAQALTQALDAATHGDTDAKPDELDDELGAVAGNANLDTDTAMALYRRLEGHLHRIIAGNAALGPDNVHTLWHRSRDRALLANPWMPSAALEAHCERDLVAAGRNPNASDTVLRRCVEHAAARRSTLWHPHLPDDIVARALQRASDIGSYDGWSAITRNRHRVGIEALVDLLRRIESSDVRDDPEGPATGESIRAGTCDSIRAEIDERRWDTNPGERPIEHLRGHEIPAPIATALRCGGAHADAIIVLLRNGLSGTVGELVDVAASVTNHRYDERVAAA